MRSLYLVTLAILLSACTLPAGTYSVSVNLPADVVIGQQGSATATLTPTWDPTPTQEIDWQPTLPVFLDAVNITEYAYNVRECDSSDCRVIGRLAPGQRVEYVTSRERWLEIIWQGSTAYVWDECCVVP